MKENEESVTPRKMSDADDDSPRTLLNVLSRASGNPGNGRLLAVGGGWDGAAQGNLAKRERGDVGGARSE